jgi:hypothetical protein
MASDSKPSDLGWPTPEEESIKSGKPTDLGWPTK